MNSKSNNLSHKKSSQKRVWKRYLCLIVIVLVSSIIFVYYLRMTYYEIKSLDPRISFECSELGFFYTYTGESLSLYQTYDEGGFAIVRIGKDYYRQPVTHANNTMREYHAFIETRDKDVKNRFLCLADIFLNEGIHVKLDSIPGLIWQYHFQVPSYAQHPVPWISCLAQGKAISVLCRVYQLTGNQKYINAAILATGPFHVSVKKGGLVSEDSEGNIYYEEYPFPGQSHHVLNGFITSLFGLYDLYRISGDQTVKNLFDIGISTLQAKGVLERYDLGFWTTYCQSPQRNMAFKYNRLHVYQLWALAKITGNEHFQRMGDKWLLYNRKHRYRIKFFFHATLHYLQNIDKIPMRSLIR